jgi:hypothetical protein
LSADPADRIGGLVCLGAGAGLIRGDVRGVRGSDAACRSGGVIVQVRGPPAHAVPVWLRPADSRRGGPPSTGRCEALRSRRRQLPH